MSRVMNMMTGIACIERCHRAAMPSSTTTMMRVVSSGPLALEDALGNARKPPPEDRTPAAWATGIFDILLDPEPREPHALTDAEEALLERDAWQQAVALRTPDGQVVRFRYDANDRLLERIEA